MKNTDLWVVEGRPDSDFAGDTYAICDSEYKANVALEMIRKNWGCEDLDELGLHAHKSGIPLNTIISDDTPTEITSQYFDVHFQVAGDCKEGYSIFVEASDENEAVQIITDKHLYEEPEDLNHIDYIDTITAEQYFAGAHH